MADKIDQITLNGTSYDIDLPPDATPSIASITTSGDVTVGGNITKNGNTYTLPSSGGELALSINIPTKTSDLTNDSSYQTASQVTTAINNALTSVYKFQGSIDVSTLNSLISSTTDKSVLNGYVYNITDSGNLNNSTGTLSVGVGDNVAFVYIGGQDSAWEWDKLAGTIDLSNYVPTSRTINGKALTNNITLSSSDVGALPSSTSYVSSVNGSSGVITNVAKTDADNNFSVAQTFKDITLYAASGDSPRLTFQRGTLTDTYNDWSIYDTGGYLHIQQRGSGSSDWGTMATFTQSGVSFVGTVTIGTSGSVASGNTNAVTGGAVYNALPTFTLDANGVLTITTN